MPVRQEKTPGRLKAHFAVRVHNEARYLVGLWDSARQHGWQTDDGQAMLRSAQRLLRHARRFQLTEYQQVAQRIIEVLEAHQRQCQSCLLSNEVEQLHAVMQALLNVRGQDDRGGPALRLRLSKPVYLALADSTLAARLASQLAGYGVRVRRLESLQQLQDAFIERYPQITLLDVDFSGIGQGIEVARQLSARCGTALPLAFYAAAAPDMALRLATVRLGSRAFFVQDVEAPALLMAAESDGFDCPLEAVRVLIVEDSPTQALQAEKALNSALIVTRVLHEPMHLLAEMERFAPDLLILDMHMPSCTGDELARIVRQCECYVGVPIMYFSAESNTERQLEAMQVGADEFLPKGISPAHLIAAVRNRVARARKLRTRMVSDSLTGLYNHRHILQLLEDAVSQSAHTGAPFSLIMLDIDLFKQVNDRHGHQAGDRVIHNLAVLLRQRLRSSDLIGRYGGEEFLLVMPGTAPQEAVHVAEDLRQAFARLIHELPDGAGYSCTFSAGVAGCEQGALQTDAGEFLAQADKALYAAKAAGRNQVVLAR